MKTRKRNTPTLHSDPHADPHKFVKAPLWKGTIVGIDFNIEQGIEFSALLEQIRRAYFIDVKAKKDHAKRIRFS
jgi:hypothetical protein